MTLFDAAEAIGGQFNLAKQVPGKEELTLTLTLTLTRNAAIVNVGGSLASVGEQVTVAATGSSFGESCLLQAKAHALTAIAHQVRVRWLGLGLG